jgi:hypothetical protein
MSDLPMSNPALKLALRRALSIAKDLAANYTLRLAQDAAADTEDPEVDLKRIAVEKHLVQDAEARIASLETLTQ